MLPLAREKEFDRPADEAAGGAAELSATLTVREAVRPASARPRATGAACGTRVVGLSFKPVQN